MATQLIAFNQSTAGTTKGLCEQNVRLGFGIPAKYASAWDNWLHTDQHIEPIPDGVDVGVFFSYGTNGHVGVRLANGKFWSDGNTYESIQAYESNHTPKYVGWSTKVDDVAVIKLTGGNTMFPNIGDLTNIHNATGWPGHVPNNNDVAYWTTGTGNPSWSKGADQVWKDLIYEVSKYVQAHPQQVSSTTLSPGIYKVN